MNENRLKLYFKVQEPPSWVMKPSNVQGIEAEKAEIKCQALGRPVPKYTWVDKEGNDAAEKEGMIAKAFVKQEYL